MLRDAIDTTIEIVSTALLSSTIGAAIGIVWFVIETAP